MKISSKILGALIILVVGFGFLFYGNLNRTLNMAEKAYHRGDFEQAAILYKRSIDSFWKRLLFSKTVEKIELTRAWAFYNQGYYSPEKYDLAEKVVNRNLNKRKSCYKDQFYNLKALIYWQRGVELFVKIGKKAINSKELDKFIDVSREDSGKAVRSNDGNDWDIKYNYEFFRQPKKKLKQYMQQAAKQKMKGRKISEEANKQAKEKLRADQKSKKEQEKKARKGRKGEIKTFMPKDQHPNQPTSGSAQKKKKKKG